MSNKASRRKYQRIGCNIAAVFNIGQLNAHVTIQNFCTHGFLVACSTPTFQAVEQLHHKHHLNSKSTPIMLGTLSLQLNSMPYESLCELRRLNDNELGLFVVKGIDSLLYSQLSHTSQVADKISSQPANEHSQTLASAPQQRLIAHKVNQVFWSCVLKPVQEYFDSLDQHLFEVSKSVLDEAKKQSLYTASNNVTRNKRELNRNFQSMVTQSIQAFLTCEKTQPIGQAALTSQSNLHSMDQLSLVDSDTFDYWVVVKSIAQRMENQLDQLVQQVHSRTKNYYPHIKDSALLPKGNLQLLQQLLESNDFDVTSVKIALEYFSSLMVKAFEQFLTQFAQDLKLQGYLDHLEIERAVIKNKNNPKPKQTPSDQDHEVKASQSKEGDSSIAQSALLKATQLLDELKAKREHYQATMSANTQSISSFIAPRPAPKMSEANFKELVSEFHRELWLAPDHLVLKPQLQPIELKNYLATKFKKRSKELGVELDHEHRTIIEVMDHVFDSILFNEYLIAELRLIISHLRALFALDYVDTSGTTFIEGNNLFILLTRLQLIAYEPMAWTGRNKKFLTHQLTQLQGIIDYPTINAALSEMLNNFSETRQKSIDKIVDACESKYHIQAAHHYIREFLVEFSTDLLFPKWFDLLMRNGWVELLTLTAVRHGIQSTELNYYLQQTRQIVKQVNQQVPIDQGTIINIVYDGLNSITIEAKRVEQSIDNIRFLLTNSQASDTQALLKLGLPGPWLLAQKNISKVGTSFYYQKVAKLHVNDWFTCPRQAINKRFMQLIWIAPDRQSFHFVNHCAVSIGELSVHEVFDLFKEDNAHKVYAHELQFMPQGSSQYLYLLYEKMRFGLSRDQQTGFLNRYDFNEYLENFHHTDSRNYSLCLIQMQQIEAIIKSNGHDIANDCFIALSEQVKAAAVNWNQLHDQIKIDFISRIDQYHICFALIGSPTLEQQTQLIHRVYDFLRERIEQHTLKLAQGTIFPNLQMVAVQQNSHKFVAASECINKARSATRHFQNESNKHLLIIQAENTTEYSKEAQIVQWLLTIPTLDQKQLSSSKLLENTLVYAFNPEYTDQPTHIYFVPQTLDATQWGFKELRLAAQEEGLSSRLDQYVITEAILKMQQLRASKAKYNTQVDEHFSRFIAPISVKSTRYLTFFEFMFNQLSQIKSTCDSNLRLHIALSAEEVVHYSALEEFAEELKSFGCLLHLTGWGPHPNAFEVSQTKNLFETIEFHANLFDYTDQLSEDTKGAPLSELFKHHVFDLAQDIASQQDIAFVTPAFEQQDTTYTKLALLPKHSFFKQNHIRLYPGLY